MTLFDQQLKDLFALQGPIVEGWRKAVEPITSEYRSLEKLYSGESSPHVLAWDAAVGTIIQLEEDSVRANGEKFTHGHFSPAEARVGAPFPQGEARFKTEALLTTINLRLGLARVTAHYAEQVRIASPIHSARGKFKDNLRTRRAMVDRLHVLVWAILSSCEKDAMLSRDLCEASKTWRLALKTIIVRLRDRVLDQASFGLPNEGEWTLQDWTDKHIRPVLESMVDEWGERLGMG